MSHASAHRARGSDCRERTTEPITPANAGSASRLQSHASGPAWLRSTLAYERCLLCKRVPPYYNPEDDMGRIVTGYLCALAAVGVGCFLLWLGTFLGRRKRPDMT
jgi:hypothetical protein